MGNLCECGEEKDKIAAQKEKQDKQNESGEPRIDSKSLSKKPPANRICYSREAQTYCSSPENV